MSARREPQHCLRCGVASEPLQEYCLECGERIPANRGTVGALAAAWRRRLPWYPGDWIWPALLFLVIAVVATAISAATTSGSSTTQPIGTHRSATVAAPTPTVTTGPPPKTPGAPSTLSATTPAPPVAAGLVAWPGKGTAYTDVLASVPLSEGRTFAVARAHEAKAAGLPRAGVLVSAEYASLRPGYYVVFSGVYSSPAAAVAGLTAAHARGFPDAYVARVTHP